jgi:hypothetical protein
MRIFIAALLAALAAGCAGPRSQMTASEARTFIGERIPASVADRDGWAADIHTAMSVLEVPITADNVCAVTSITAQESGFRVDPPIPELPKLAWAEIERQREKVGVPRLVLDAALSLRSTNGKTYRERIDAVKTERDLSEIFEDLIGRVPMGKTFFEDRNPVRTGGPMQVSVNYAREHAGQRKYPYPVVESIRDEVFTRRGGIYFGVAHLFDYPVSYDRYLYRYADYNAGHYASRNAAFQAALASLSGTKLVADGDLRTATENAARDVKGLGLDASQVRRDLDAARRPEFERTELYRRVFALADERAGKPVARAAVPQIELQSPKFTRRLTTEWFAERVVARHRQCLNLGQPK